MGPGAAAASTAVDADLQMECAPVLEETLTQSPPPLHPLPIERLMCFGDDVSFFGFILPDLRSHIRDVPPSHHKLKVFILEVTNSRFQASDIYVFIVCIFVVQLTYLCLY